MIKSTRTILKKHIETLEGFDFERFINELFILKYGIENFIPIREIKDKGSDGIIISENKVLSCYAPKKYDNSSFKIKILGNENKEGDYNKFEKNWKNQYKYFEIIVNHEISPYQITLVNGLENSSIKGIDQLMHIIEHELKSKDLRKLAEYLEIGDLIKKDYILEIINDLLDKSNNYKTKETVIFDKSKLLNLNEKIKLNFNEEDWDGLMKEINLIIKEFETITELIADYDDYEKDAIKKKVISDYNNLNGDFKTRLNNLTNQYIEKFNKENNDDYKIYLRTFLLFIFEQCLIGKTK